MHPADYLVYASPENIRTCMLWVNNDVSARGTTDIKTPLMQALRLLQAAPVQAGDIRLPVVFLLTDGAHTHRGCRLGGGALTRGGAWEWGWPGLAWLLCEVLAVAKPGSMLGWCRCCTSCLRLWCRSPVLLPLLATACHATIFWAVVCATCCCCLCVCVCVCVSPSHPLQAVLTTSVTSARLLTASSGARLTPMLCPSSQWMHTTDVSEAPGNDVPVPDSCRPLGVGIWRLRLVSNAC